MDKSTRWTLYIALIIAVIGFGYWLTYTQRPDTYTHQDPPDPSVLPSDQDDATVSGPAPDAGEPTDEASAQRADGGPVADGTDDKAPPQGWAIHITGEVTQVNVLDIGQGEEFMGIRLDYDAIDTVGEPPSMASPVLAIGERAAIESDLGRSPDAGDRVTIESRGIDRQMQSLAIHSIEFSTE